jgi:chemotaxis protein CheX
MERQSGTLSISFSEKSILAIVSNMLGEKIPQMNDDIKDAVGEITNMISGQARQRLAAIGISLQGALPAAIGGGKPYDYAFYRVSRCFCSVSD